MRGKYFFGGWVHVAFAKLSFALETKAGLATETPRTPRKAEKKNDEVMPRSIAPSTSTVFVFLGALGGSVAKPICSLIRMMLCTHVHLTPPSLLRPRNSPPIRTYVENLEHFNRIVISPLFSSLFSTTGMIRHA